MACHILHKHARLQHANHTAFYFTCRCMAEAKAWIEMQEKQPGYNFVNKQGDVDCRGAVYYVCNANLYSSSSEEQSSLPASSQSKSNKRIRRGYLAKPQACPAAIHLKKLSNKQVKLSAVLHHSHIPQPVMARSVQLVPKCN